MAKKQTLDEFIAANECHGTVGKIEAAQPEIRQVIEKFIEYKIRNPKGVPWRKFAAWLHETHGWPDDKPLSENTLKDYRERYLAKRKA